MKKGIVLVVVLWVLALVWLLAIIFLMAATTEKAVSSNYVLSSRAEFAARSGIEFAVSRLNESVQKGWTANDLLDMSWQYNGIESLEDTVIPSFAREQLVINSKLQRVSGMTSIDDVFKLKVLDSQGQINVNDGITLPNDHALNKNLARVLNTLGTQVGVKTIKLGDEILRNRPAGGYKNKYELVKAVGGDVDLFNRFKDHVTTHSWKNPTVSMPVPLSSHEVSKGTYPITYQRPTDSNGTIYRYGSYSPDLLISYVKKMMLDPARQVYDSYFTPAVTKEMKDKINGVAGSQIYGEMGLVDLIKILRENVELRTKTGTGTWTWVDEHGITHTGTGDTYDYDAVWKEIVWYRIYRYITPKWGVSSNNSKISYWLPVVPDTSYRKKIQDKINEINKVANDLVSHGYTIANPIWDYFCTVNSTLNEKQKMLDNCPKLIDLINQFIAKEAAVKELIDLIEKIPSQAPYSLCFVPGKEILGISSYDSLNPQWIEIVERAPVNINSASRQVLVSLIAGLQGFFMMSPKVGEPRNIFYYWMGHQYLYIPSLQSQSQIGALHTTLPFIDNKDTTSVVDGFPAQVIADEIIACRNSKKSSYSGIDYSTLPFGGPFKSWAQFNKFVDYLVEKGVLVDHRNIYFDEDFTKIRYSQTYMPNHPVQIPEPTLASYIPSTAQRRFASQAMADVLKANFNPNLHLNELNQNKILHKLVDKTDLILNSTEFCFMPMGFFEIESLGMSLTSPKNTESQKVLSKKKVSTSVKLFDVYYETDQFKFYQGAFGDRKSMPQTNNTKAVETGPEPDNGRIVREDEADYAASGYIGLSTNYGPGLSKQKGTLYTSSSIPNLYLGATSSPYGTKELEADILSHFYTDHGANYHTLGPDACKPIGPFAGSKEHEINFKDKTEGIPGPYSPVNGDRFKLSRSYKKGFDKFFMYSPGDLRMDGAYCEFNSAFGYKTVPFKNSFVASFWVKPNFYPELSNKAKTYLSMSDQTFLKIPDVNVWSWSYNSRYPTNHPSFGLFYFSSYHGSEDPWKVDDDTYNTSTNSTTLDNIVLNSFPRRSSFSFSNIINYLKSGSTIQYLDRDPTTGKDLRGGLGVVSPTVNHNFETFCKSHLVNGSFCSNPTTSWGHNFATNWRHDRFIGDDGGYNHFRDHEWMHITVIGKIGAPKEYNILINGKELSNTDTSAVHIPSLLYLANNQNYKFDFTKITGDTIRVGGEYSAMVIPSYRVYFADSTMDEFHFWADNDVTGVNNSKVVFENGRYYRPVDSDPHDGAFVSEKITFPKGRTLAKLQYSNIISDDVIKIGEPGLNNTGPKVKIIGVSWTCYAEDYATDTTSSGKPRMKSIMYNYNKYKNSNIAPFHDAMSPPKEQDKNGFASDTVCDLYIVNGVSQIGPFRNDAFSRVDVIEDGTWGLRYKVKFRTGMTDIASTTLLATPIFDDVTIYYTRGPAEFTSWVDLDYPYGSTPTTVPDIIPPKPITPKWTPPPDTIIPPKPENTSPGEPPPTFFEVPVTENALFVIDRSGSMAGLLAGFKPDVTAANRLGITVPTLNAGKYVKSDVVKFELKMALSQMLKHYRESTFDVVYFNDVFSSVNSKMVPLTNGSKSNTFSMVDTLSPKGKTNIYDPMKLALEIIERQKATLKGEISIYLVSDGLPNTGTITATTQIVTALTNYNKTKNINVKINTIAIPESTFLKSISDNNAGKYKPVPSIPEAQPQPPSEDEKPPMFFDIPIKEKNIVFVVDRSGSMRHPLFGYKPDLNFAKSIGYQFTTLGEPYVRYEVAQFELLKALSTLQNDVMFDVIYFNYEIIDMNSSLKKLDDTSRGQSLQYVRNMPRGPSVVGTYTYNALEKALDVIRKQKASLSGDIAIYLISDGLPEGNTITNTAEVITKVTDLNKDLGVKIHSISIPHALFLQSLSQKNGGVYKSIP